MRSAHPRQWDTALQKRPLLLLLLLTLVCFTSRTTMYAADTTTIFYTKECACCSELRLHPQRDVRHLGHHQHHLCPEHSYLRLWWPLHRIELHRHLLLRRRWKLEPLVTRLSQSVWYCLHVRNVIIFKEFGTGDEVGGGGRGGGEKRKRRIA